MVDLCSGVTCGTGERGGGLVPIGVAAPWFERERCEVIRPHLRQELGCVVGRDRRHVDADLALHGDVGSQCVEVVWTDTDEIAAPMESDVCPQCSLGLLEYRQ